MMTDDEFNTLVERANADLRRKQAALTEAYGFGEQSRFSYDQATGKLVFEDGSGNVVAEVGATPLGSLEQKSHTWRWAWANNSILESLRNRTERLKELYPITGMQIFKQPTFKADDQLAWELAAISVSHLGSLGCYRVPAEDLLVFLSIETVVARRAATL